MHHKDWTCKRPVLFSVQGSEEDGTGGCEMKEGETVRKLRRLVAKARMKKAGIHQPCKDKGNGSYFSKYWREYL